MEQVFESLMMACFGVSWPISVYKSIVSKSVKGKSLFFVIAIWLGYVAGIVGKFVSGKMSYVLVLYIINFIMVSADLVLYFINKKREEKNM